MKIKNSYWGIVALLLLPFLFMTSCKKEEDPVVVEKSTKITGKATLQAGTPGDLGNAQVAIYSSVVDWNAYQPVKIADDVNGSGAKITFVFNDVVPGNYYMDVWVDNDRSGDWSADDFVGWVGSGLLSAPALSPFMVAEGKTVNKDIQCVVF